MECNEGLAASGLKFSGSTAEEYAYYLHHNGKGYIKSRARPRFDACSGAPPPRARLAGAEE